MDAAEAEEAVQFAEGLFCHLIKLHPVFRDLSPGDMMRASPSNYDPVIGKCVMRMWFEMHGVLETELRSQCLKFVLSKQNFDNYLRETAQFVISSSANISKQIFSITATLLEVISFLYRRGITKFLRLAPGKWLIMFECVNYEEFRKIGGWRTLKVIARGLAEDYDKNQYRLLEKYWAKRCKILQPSRASVVVENAEVSGSGLTGKSTIKSHGNIPDAVNIIASDIGQTASVDLITIQTNPEATRDTESVRRISQTEENRIAIDTEIQKAPEEEAEESSYSEKTCTFETEVEGKEADDSEKFTREENAEKGLKESLDQKSFSCVTSEMTDGKGESSIEVKDCSQRSLQTAQENLNISPKELINVDNIRTQTLGMGQKCLTELDIAKQKSSALDDSIQIGSQTELKKEIPKEIDTTELSDAQLTSKVAKDETKKDQEAANARERSTLQASEDEGKPVAPKSSQSHSSAKCKTVLEQKKTPKTDRSVASGKPKSASKTPLSTRLGSSSKSQTSRQVTSTPEANPNASFSQSYESPTDHGDYKSKSKLTENTGISRRKSLPKDSTKTVPRRDSLTKNVSEVGATKTIGSSVNVLEKIKSTASKPQKCAAKKAKPSTSQTPANLKHSGDTKDTKDKPRWNF